MRIILPIVLVVVAAPVFALSLDVNPSYPGEIIVVKDAGVKILAEAGIKQPSDIRFAIVDSLKITWEDDPELITRLYKGLRSIYALPQVMSTGGGSRLVLKLKNGRTIWFNYKERENPDSKKKWIFITNWYHAPDLLALFQDVYRNREAHTRDSRIGNLDIASVRVQAPGCPLMTLPLSLPDVRLITAKATAIIDCVDLRATNASVISAKKLDETGKASGLLILELAKPVKITIDVFDEATEPFGDPDPFAANISFNQFICDRIVITHYDNDVMVRVALHQSSTQRYYVTNHYLRRRLWEKWGVENFGWPGHRISDTEYYRSPEELYKELQQTVRLAVREQE